MRDFDQEWIELTNEHGNKELIQISKIERIKPIPQDDIAKTIIHFTGHSEDHKYINTYTQIKQMIFNTYGH